MSKNDRNGIPRIAPKKASNPAPALADHRQALEQAKTSLPSQSRSALGPSSRAPELPLAAESPEQVLKVSSKSNPASVAGAISATIREKSKAEVQAIGAGAINQAVKAIAIARGYVAPMGYDLVCIPAFLDIELGGEERTAIRFVVVPQKR